MRSLKVTTWQYNAVLEELADVWSCARQGFPFADRIYRAQQMAVIFASGGAESHV